jgi:hypothetical protein
MTDKPTPNAPPPKAPVKETPAQAPGELPAKTENYPPPKDFHLAKPGSKDYVAGQPADEDELAKTEAAAKAKAEPGKETHSPHYDPSKK